MERSERSSATRARGLALALGLTASACAQQHVRLQFPGTSPGEQFRCHPITSAEIKCEGDATLDPALENRAHTAFVNLPTECEGQFNQVVIHDSGSSEPSVVVICAAQEGPVE